MNRDVRVLLPNLMLAFQPLLKTQDKLQADKLLSLGFASVSSPLLADAGGFL